MYRGICRSCYPLAGLSFVWVATALYYILHNALHAYLLVMVVVNYVKTHTLHKNHIYRARRLICMIGFAFAAIMNIGVITGILFWLAHLEIVQNIGAETYQHTKPVIMLILLFGFLVPSRWLAFVIDPIRDRYTRKSAMLLAYLHEKMTQVVPGVKIEVDAGLKELRIPIEINDARYSHSAEQPTPLKEAEQLHAWIQEGKILSAVGPYLPSLRIRDEQKYNLAVAKYLKRLQTQQWPVIVATPR